MKNRILFYLMVFISLTMFWGYAFAEQNPKTADNRVNSAVAADEQVHALAYPVRFFRKYISPVDGDRCPMYPSCSQYCLEAAQKHGLLMGWIMACDRLVRCGRDEVKLSPPVMVNGAERSYDPLINNDFWW